jgi:hypothetical protein
MSEQPKQKPWIPTERGTVSGQTAPSAPPPARAAGRPLGVTVISILNFVIAALFVVVIVLSLTSATSRETTLVWVAILPVIISLGLGFALWRMMPWARNTAIVLYLVYAASGLLNLFSREITLAGIASVVIPAAIVAYLLQPRVGRAFEQAQK